jgi:hypothetical protein
LRGALARPRRAGSDAIEEADHLLDSFIEVEAEHRAETRVANGVLGALQALLE